MQIWKIRIVDCTFAKKKNLLQMANALVLVFQLSHNGTKAFLLSHWNTFTPMYILWFYGIFQFFSLYRRLVQILVAMMIKKKIFQDFATWIINSITTLKWLWTNCMSQRLAPVDTSHLKFKLEKKKIKEGVYHKSTKLG